MKPINFSIVAPAFNESQIFPQFIVKTYSVAKKITADFELIIVDDGSTDNSWSVLRRYCQKYPRLKAIRLRRRSGQTAALMAGFHHAQGKVIITIDADLQQDPQDMVKLLAKIDQGADVVSGRRPFRKRQLINRFITGVEKLLLKFLLKIDLADTNVSPNAYRRETLSGINLFGEMHRYLVPLLKWRGFKVVTVPVSLRPRQAGISKYKHSKAVRGFLDLLMVKFWQDYSVRPIQLFGRAGLILIALGLLIGLLTVVRKFIFHLALFNLSLLLLAIFLIIIGLQFFIFGILADIMARIYYQTTPDYQIAEVL